MKAFYTQVGTSEPTKFAQYLYDGGGNRVMKVVRVSGGNYAVRLYLGGIEEYYEVDSSVNQGYQNEIMVGDAARKRIGTAYGDTSPAIKYNFPDQVSSSNVLCDDTGALINREEYYAFGETSFGSYAKKRYRFSGKERDDESGLYYYGARYYLPWTCRFINVDPIATDFPNLSPFNYAGNKPITYRDIYGLQGEGDTPSNNQSGSSTYKDPSGNDITLPPNTINPQVYKEDGTLKGSKKYFGEDSPDIPVKKGRLAAFTIATENTTENGQENVSIHYTAWYRVTKLSDDSESIDFLGYRDAKGNTFDPSVDERKEMQKVDRSSIAFAIPLGGASTAAPAAALIPPLLLAVAFGAMVVAIGEAGYIAPPKGYEGTPLDYGEDLSTTAPPPPLAIPLSPAIDVTDDSGGGKIRIALGTDQYLTSFAAYTNSYPYGEWAKIGFSMPNETTPAAYAAKIIALGLDPRVEFHFLLSTEKGLLNSPENLAKYSNSITVAEYNVVSTIYRHKTTFYIKSGSIYKKTDMFGKK